MTRKSRNLKVISGTVQPCRDRPEADPGQDCLAEMPAAPDWLPNAHAVKEWDRLGPLLVAQRRLTAAGLSKFAILCSIHGRVVQLLCAGESPNAALIGQYRVLSNDFGLNPVAPESEGSAPVANRFGRNGKRPA